MRQLLHCSAALALALVLAAGASASTTIEWNFNAGTSPGNASTGVGTSSGFFFPFTSSLPLQNGSPNDTNPVIVNGGPNNAVGPRSGPQPFNEAPGLRPASFFTSTENASAPMITWDFNQGYRASRFYQMEATADGGATWDPLPAGGTGSSISGPFGTASIDDTGLITIETIDGLILDGTGNGFMHDLMYSFPSGTAYDDNPDFGFRIFATTDPNGSEFVSSFAGTDGNDAVSGYIRNTSLGGSEIRYDLVRVKIPEPTTAVLAMGLLATLGVCRRR